MIFTFGSILLAICFIDYTDQKHLNVSAIQHVVSTNRFQQLKEKYEKNILKNEEKNTIEDETKEDDDILAMRNLDNEIRTRERLQINDKIEDENNHNNISAPAAPGCSVLRSGVIDVETNPLDVLKTQKFNLSLTEDSLILNFIGNPSQIYKRFSFPAIEMPLETLGRDRDCFIMYYKDVPYVLCGENTTQRDDWAAAIVEAVFCFNSGIRPKKVKENFEEGKAIKLSEKSTKEMRWKKLETQRQKEKQKDEENENSVEEKPKGEEVSEIEITGMINGNPKVTLNGEDLPLYEPKKVEEEEQMQKFEF